VEFGARSIRFAGRNREPPLIYLPEVQAVDRPSRYNYSEGLVKLVKTRRGSVLAEEELLDLAIELFRDAYRHQMSGEFREAVELYRQSIETYPTAEAYTFLGWTYSFMGDFDTAIAECHHAIETDPDFGNPYNDIGVYLIEKGQLAEAIPWLQMATGALRYDNPAFPYYNLGRVWEMKHQFNLALANYQKAAEIDPRYTLATTGIRRLRAMSN